MCVASLLSLFVDMSEDPFLIQFIMKNILVIGFFFFGYGSFYYINRMRCYKELLIINDEGITDNSMAISLGFIPWEDIEDAYIDGVFGCNFIELKVRNEAKYLREIHILKKIVIYLNKKMGHQIACITLNTTKYSLDDVLGKIKEYMLATDVKKCNE